MSTSGSTHHEQRVRIQQTEYVTAHLVENKIWSIDCFIAENDGDQKTKIDEHDDEHDDAADDETNLIAIDNIR